jgi:hypothetical protein
MSVTLDCKCLLLKKLKLGPDNGDSGSNDCKLGCGDGGECFWRESGVRRSVLCWYFSRRENVSAFNIV